MLLYLDTSSLVKLFDRGTAFGSGTRVGRLAAKHALRGFDAIHQSAARMLISDARGTAIAFSSFDNRLNRAAAKENMTVLHP